MVVEPIPKGQHEINNSLQHSKDCRAFRNRSDIRNRDLIISNTQRFRTASVKESERETDTHEVKKLG